MVDNRTNFAKEIAALLRDPMEVKSKYLERNPHSVRAKEISAEGKSIFAHDPGGKVAEGYKNLTKEVLKLEKQREKVELASVDDLFSTGRRPPDAPEKRFQKSRCRNCIRLRKHPFKVRDDEAMMETADSIKQYIVLVPAIAQPDPEGGYELAAGHRRQSK